MFLEAFDKAASPSLYDPEALHELQCEKRRNQINAKINKYW